MGAVAAALLFTTGFAVAIWTIWTTVAPRLDYMRALWLGEVAMAPVPVHANRARATARSTPRRVSAPLRATAPLRAAG